MAGQLKAPVRKLEVQRVPTLRAPALGDARTFEHQVLAAPLTQMPAHSQTGLTCTDDDGLNLLVHAASARALASGKCYAGARFLSLGFCWPRVSTQECLVLVVATGASGSV
jgi:hypothetical protein